MHDGGCCSFNPSVTQVALFRRGRLVVVDAPHYMDPMIPDRIAREITTVADAT